MDSQLPEAWLRARDSQVLSRFFSTPFPLSSPSLFVFFSAFLILETFEWQSLLQVAGVHASWDFGMP
jgi:hypothetical protein